jgi:PAS domain S-box-containing protein
VARNAEANGVTGLPERIVSATDPEESTTRTDAYRTEGSDSENTLGSVEGAPGETNDRRFEQVAEHLNEVIWMTTPDKSEMLYVNPAYEEVWGRSREQLYESPKDFLDAIHPDDRARVEEAIEMQSTGNYNEEYRIIRPDGTIRWIRDQAVPIDDLQGETTRIVGIAEDTTDFKKRERMLASLHDATRLLIADERPIDVLDHATQIASDVLDLSEVAFYCYEEETSELRPKAWSDGVEELLGGRPPVFDRQEDSLAWDAYENGVTKLFNDVRRTKKVFNPDTPFRSELIVPVDDHGILIGGSTDIGSFDEADLEFAEILAANVEAVMNRLERQKALRGRDRMLHRRNDELDKLNRISTLARQVDSAVSEATTRRGIEQRVCERLVDGSYVCCWIGTPAADETTVNLRARSDSAGFRLEQFEVPSSDTETLLDPIAEALESRTVVNTTLNETPSLDLLGGERADADQYSVAVIPLVSGPTHFGFLTAYAPEPESFDSDIRDVLGDIGERIGLAIDAAENRKMLFSDAIPELEFRMSDQSLPLVGCSNRLGCSFEFEQTVMVDDAVLAYVAVTGAEPETVFEDLSAAETVTETQLLRETGDGALCELTMTPNSKIFQTLERGAQIRAATVADGIATITVHVSPDINLQHTIDELKTVFPDAQLVSKRSVTPTRNSDFDRPVGFDRQLSERQRQVLQTAHAAGYFGWPRETTIKELAENFDITQSTVNYHLRNALQSVLDYELTHDQ